MRIKPVAAVCTLPLVKDCSAGGRKVGKWMHQYWIQSVLPSKCNGSFSANIRKRLMEGFPSQLDWTQHEVLPWYTHWTVFNSAFWLPNFAVFGMKGEWGRNWVLLYVYQPMELLKKKNSHEASTSSLQSTHKPGKRNKWVIIIVQGSCYFIFRIFFSYKLKIVT